MNPHFIDELVARLEAENTQSAQPTKPSNDARQEMRRKNAEALRILGIK